jgi:YesN/AraC family two-component response regulator
MGKGIILEMLALILRSLTPSDPNNSLSVISEKDKQKQTLVNHTIYYLENHHQEDITLEMLADMLYISPAQLSKVFRKITGRSPIKYLIEIRLKHAYELLLHTNLTVKEIAEKVGYHDPFYFSKLFKKHYDLAPSNVRKRN